jgi:hypothetical protein
MAGILKPTSTSETQLAWHTTVGDDAELAHRRCDCFNTGNVTAGMVRKPKGGRDESHCHAKSFDCGSG